MSACWIVDLFGWFIVSLLVCSVVRLIACVCLMCLRLFVCLFVCLVACFYVRLFVSGVC